MAIDPDVLSNAIEFWNKLYQAGEATVKFEKQDGTIRIMRCTLDFTKIPRKDYPKKNINIPKILKLAKKNKIVHVYDLDKKGWRSVPIDRVDFLEIGDTRFKVRID